MPAREARRSPGRRCARRRGGSGHTRPRPRRRSAAPPRSGRAESWRSRSTPQRRAPVRPIRPRGWLPAELFSSALYGQSGSSLDLRRDPPGFDRIDDRRVVTLVLIGVGLCEGGQGPVEAVSATQIARDRNAVAGPGVGPGQGPAADAGRSRRERSGSSSRPGPSPSRPIAGGRSSRARPRRRRWS